MKRVLLLTFLAAFLSAAASAQSQPVKVVSYDGIELAFSYVYVNGKPIGVADKDGKLNIPSKSIHKGDTISATYVGHNKCDVVYDAHNKDGYTIRLTRDMSEKVSVYSRKEMRKEFRQVMSCAPVAWHDDFKLRFVIDINGKEYFRGNMYHYDASVVGFGSARIMTNMYIPIPEKDRDILQDTTKVAILNDIVAPIVRGTFLRAGSGAMSDRGLLELMHVKVTKIKEEGRIRSFSYSRSGIPYVYVEVDTLYKDIVAARADNGRFKYMATYKTYIPPASINPHIKDKRYPSTVEATWTMSDGTVFNIDIYDTEMLRNSKAIKKFNRSNTIRVAKSYFDIPEALKKYKHLLPQPDM